MIDAMAAMYLEQIDAVEVGKYFVHQYYQVIQQNPAVGYQFYSDASTVTRVDGEKEESANSTLKIHELLSKLNFTSIEIKALHSLASWARGVLVVVSGYVKIPDYYGRRQFVQTFFLAPQEKGYFVLTDVLHLLEEETALQPPIISGHDNYGASSNVPNHHEEDPGLGYTVEEVQTRDYVSPVNVLEEELQSRDYLAPPHTDEIDTVDKYSIPEPQQAYEAEQAYETHQAYEAHQAYETHQAYDAQQAYETQQAYEAHQGYETQQAYEPQQPYETQQVYEADDRLDDISVDPVASYATSASMVRDPPVTASEEPLGERPKKTYASILLHAKGQPVNSVPRPAQVTKVTQAVPDAQYMTAQQSYPAASGQSEISSSQAVEDVTTTYNEGEVNSVYVGNLSASISAFDLEQEFKKFGKILPNGVSVRSRKESGGYYAFVEYEDAASVQNALEASSLVINGTQIYVEGRRPNSGISRFGGGRRGRGRGGNFGGRGYSRGNGVPQRAPRQDRGILGNHGATY